MRPSCSINANLKILLLSLPLLILAFFQEWRDYFQLWSTSYVYRHGFLVFAGTLFLLYQRRHSFQKLSINFSRSSLAILACLLAALLLAHAGNIKLVRLLLLPLILIAWGSTVWGAPFTRLVAAPVLLLLFAAPFWDELSPALQWLTVLVDEWVLAMLSIPATIDEFYITIPSGVFHVAHGCSGIRYLMVAMYIGAFYGCMTRSGVIRTAAMVAVATFLALLTNWIRVGWIIAAGHYTDMESSLVTDHELFGWIVFIVVTLIPFFAISRYLEKVEHTAGPTIRSEPPNAPKSKYKAILPASITLLAFPALLALQAQLAQKNAYDWKPKLPEPDSKAWGGPLRHAEFWEPRFYAEDIHLSGVYVSESQEQAQLDFFGYSEQGQGKELIYYKNSVFNPKNWQPVETKSLQLGSDNLPHTKEVNHIILRNRFSGNLAAVWYWYTVGGRRATAASEVQIMSAFKKLLGDQRAGAWILSTECRSQDVSECRSEAKTRFESFLSHITPTSADKNPA
jgi:exosortase A